MKLSLVISTYNQPAALAKVLCAVERQTSAPDDVLVADDGSEEPTRKVIAEFQARGKIPLRHVWQPHDGFRKTFILNEAIKKTVGEYIVLLDGDCVPHSQFIADHRELAERGFWVQGRRAFVKKPFVAGFEPAGTPILLWLLTGKMSGVFKGLRLPFPLVSRNTGQRGIIGCNLGCWREDLVAINGFDESYTGWGAEDSDLGSRLYHLGRPRKFVHGRAIVYHLDHPSLPRERAPENFARLDAVLRSRKIRCEQGLAQHA